MALVQEVLDQGPMVSKVEPELSFFDAVDNDAWRSMRGFITPEAAAMLYRHAYDASPDGDLVEIGSLAGKSTVCIARALRDSGKNSRLTAIDIKFQSDFHGNLAKFGVSDRVKTMRMPSVNAADVWRTPLSMIYIDGSHAKAHAYADFMTWDVSLLVGGTMALDDTYGFFVGPILQLHAAVESGAYEPLGNFGGVCFLRKKRPIIACVGDFPMQSGSLVSYVDFVGSWIGAMDLEFRLPVGQGFPRRTERRSVGYLADRALDMSPRLAAAWIASKLAARRLSRQKCDARTGFVAGPLRGPIQILEWLESMRDLDEPARATVSYLRGCLEMLRLEFRAAIDRFQPLCGIGPMTFPHYNVEIRQLALLRLAQACDLAGDRSPAKDAYQRLVDDGAIAEIRQRAEAGLAGPFRLPAPVQQDLTEYVLHGGLHHYKRLA